MFLYDIKNNYYNIIRNTIDPDNKLLIDKS